MKGNKQSRKKLKMYSLERKRELGSLLLGTMPVLENRLIVKEMITIKDCTGLHQNRGSRLWGNDVLPLPCQLFSNQAQAHLSKDGTTHSDMSPPTSISNQGNFLGILESKQVQAFHPLRTNGIAASQVYLWIKIYDKN